LIRIGSLGSGKRGRICKPAHRPGEGFEVVAACDIRPEIEDDWRKTVRPDIHFYTDYRKLLDQEKLDAVFVTSPDHLHEEMTLAALDRGLHVFLEKPMAITIEGCDRILAAARKSGAKLYIGHNMRFFPVIRKMKEIIDSGRIGEVQAIWCRHFIAYGGDAYFKDWHSERKYVTSLLLQKGAHDIDVIHFLAGAYTTRTVGMGKLSVYNRVTDKRRPDEGVTVEFNLQNWPPLAQTKMSPVIDVEDHSMMLMQLSNGVQASYEQCHYTPDSCRNYTIIGTKGRIENCNDFSLPDSEAIIRIWDRRVNYVENGTESIAIPPLHGSHAGADPLTLDAFLRYLKTGQNDGAKPEDARMSVAAGVMATQSLRSGNIPLDIPPIPEAASRH
jgi:predicted dehydrogenase